MYQWFLGIDRHHNTLFWSFSPRLSIYADRGKDVAYLRYYIPIAPLTYLAH